MAVKAAHLRIIAKIVPAAAGDSGFAHVLAGARGVCGASRQLHSADAEGADGDEYTIGDSAERPERRDGDEYCSMHRGGRAGWQAAGGVPGSTRQSQQGDHRQEPGRHLAAGTVSGIAAATGRLGSYPTADGGLRCGSAGHAAAAPECAGAAPARVGPGRGAGSQAQAKGEKERQVVQERAELQSDSGTTARDRCGPKPYRRDQSDDDYDGDQRGWTGQEAAYDQGSLRFLA